jgi:hypothetical protein
VVRGGSWNNNQDNARAAYRNHNNPDNRNNNQGFRVVCSSHMFTPLQRQRRWLVSLPTSALASTPTLTARAALPALAADHGLRPEAKG